jgi:predicted neutral ceramidase superfamily lipid hydrolase
LFTEDERYEQPLAFISATCSERIRIMIFHLLVGVICTLILVWACHKQMFKSIKDFLLVVETIAVIFFVMQNWDTIAQFHLSSASIPLSTEIQTHGVESSSNNTTSIKVVATPSPHTRSQPKQKANPTPLKTSVMSSGSERSGTETLITGFSYLAGGSLLLVIVVLVFFVSVVSRKHRNTPLTEMLGQRCLECGKEKHVKGYRYQRGQAQVTGQICADCADTLHATAV